MAILGVDTKCYILALFIRDDNERFLLGSGYYEFKESQMHFSANTVANDVVEVQGNDGYLLAGQVRRPGSQSFDGYVGDGTVDKTATEAKRREFFAFFRKNHFYKVVYVFADGTAIQRKRGFLVDDPTVQELYQQYPEYHVALNFEDVNYYTYSENGSGEEIYAQEADVFLTHATATGGLVWGQYGVVWEDTQWGGIVNVPAASEIQIDNELSVPVPIENVEIKGDTYQQTYSGKNLVDAENATWQNRATAVTQTDGVFKMTANPGAAARACLPLTRLVEGTMYTVSFEALGASIASDPSYTFANIREQNNGGSWLSNSTRTSASSDYVKYSLSFTANSISNPWVWFYLSSSTDNTNNVEIYVKNIQLEAGSTATEYEPYVGGTASPNPDYPQDIEVVTGEQTVTVSGKNLLRIPNGTNTSGGVTWTVADNVVSGSGTSTSSSTNILSNQTLAKTWSAGTYTFSINSPIAYTLILYTIDENGTGTNRTITRGDTSVTFTTNNAIEKYRLALGGLTTGTALNVSLSINMQLEEGSNATDYQPYHSQSYTVDLGSTELCKIGDYQDYIYKSGDNWYVHKETGKVIFDGSESWSWNGTYSRLSTPNPPDILPGSGVGVYSVWKCTHLLPGNTGVLSNDNVFNGGGTNFFVKATSVATSVSAWKSWLNSNNVTLYYALATPTDTQITDTNLIADLEALGAMKLFIGENNLEVLATSTNLPGSLGFDYYTEVTRTGAVWEEGGNGGPTVVDIDSIDNVYPIWEVTGPAVNPQLSVLTTNTTLSYAGTVTAGQTLVIDMFNKTAKLNGTSVIGNISGEWVNFAPGDNRVVYSTNNADAPSSKIYWQEVVG